MEIQIDVSAISDTGLIRENNEDNLYVCGLYMQQGEQGQFKFSELIRTDSFICAVCDGLGGENSGERASLTAVSRLQRTASGEAFSAMPLEDKIRAVDSYVGETNDAIYRLGASSPDSVGMGTTFACLVIGQAQAAALHVGDSRVYIYRKGALTQLTRDHSESERLIRAGVITREQARGHVSRFMLTKNLGMPPEAGFLKADIFGIIQLEENDIFLLCSDGLTDMIEDDNIKEILSACPDANKAARQLVSRALKNGGRDNVTAIVVKIDKILYGP